MINTREGFRFLRVRSNLKYHRPMRKNSRSEGAGGRRMNSGKIRREEGREKRKAQMKKKKIKIKNVRRK